MKIQKILQDLAMLEAVDCTQEKILRVLQEGLQAFSELEQQEGENSFAFLATSMFGSHKRCKLSNNEKSFSVASVTPYLM